MVFQMLLCGYCYENVYDVQTARHAAKLEYNCKALFETPCTTSESHI
jgi:hypothetical protein